MNRRVPLSRDRAAIWTLLPVLSANGKVVTTLLLERCRSLPVDAMKFCASHDLCVAATENAQQTEDSWIRFANVWLPKCGTSLENPGLVYVDGHSTHVSRSFIQLAAQHSL